MQHWRIYIICIGVYVWCILQPITKLFKIGQIKDFLPTYFRIEKLAEKCVDLPNKGHQLK